MIMLKGICSIIRYLIRLLDRLNIKLDICLLCLIILYKNDIIILTIKYQEKRYGNREEIWSNRRKC